MNCPQCGCFMAQLVETFREVELGPNDELVEKETTHFYEQCNRPACRYAETSGIEIAERKLHYYIIIAEEYERLALTSGY